MNFDRPVSQRTSVSHGSHTETNYQNSARPNQCKPPQPTVHGVRFIGIKFFRTCPRVGLEPFRKTPSRLALS